ncbi:hypothetical protein IL306_003488 [Fusarium sp. DS 682]|nr:hypothetical protein IL306_003488 [Fusarium sp. DS 682]
MERQPLNGSRDGESHSTTVAESGYDITTQKDHLQTLVESYHHSDDPDILEEIIQASRKALKASAEDDAKLLHTLAWSLSTKYTEGIRSFEDLQEAIRLERRAIEALPADSLDRQEYSYYLGLELGDSFHHTGKVADLDEALYLIKTSLDQLPEGDPMKLPHLANLGILFKERYAQLGDQDDFVKACEGLETAIANWSGDKDTQATWLERLGSVYDTRYRNLGKLEDLETVIRLWRESLSTTTDRYGKDKVIRQLQLANTLHYYYDTKRSLSHLHEAIGLTREALATTSEDDPEWLNRTRFLNIRMFLLYHETGEVTDLEEAIDIVESFLEKADEHHPHWHEQLSDHSLYLDSLSDRTGDLSHLAHLEKAILSGRSRLKAVPKNATEGLVVLHNLVAVLSKRSAVTRSLVDLEEAITYARAALDLTPDGHSERWIQLHTLGYLFLERFVTDQDRFSDLDTAISLSREALVSCPRNHQDVDATLSQLASALDRRHDMRGSSQDLEEGIRISREAISIMGKPGVGQPSAIITLGNLLQKRFNAGGPLDDINEAIDVCERTLDSIPEDSPFRTNLWCKLGDLFCSKLSKEWSTSDAEEAVRSYRSAVNHPTGRTLNRIAAAASVMPMCWSDEEVYEIGSTAIDLIPNIAAAKSLEAADRQHLLSYARGLAAAVTGAAIRLDKDPYEALAILEKGHGVLGSSLVEMRTDLKELQQDFPLLAKKFVRLREELESSSASHLGDGYQPEGDDEGFRRRKAANSLDDLIGEIRQKPGFEGFLGRLTSEQIAEAATYGPIVIVNSSWHSSEIGCEGIIIDQENLTSMVFNNLDDGYMMEQDKGFDFGTVESLEKLWDNITGPVLEILGFTETPSDLQEWPHVWWICTGPLSRYPLHASGRHRERSGNTVMDRVISSYTPSLKALLHGRRHRDVTVGQAEALLIEMEYTTGQARLPQASAEIKVVSEICESMAIRPVSLSQSKQDYLACLRTAKIFHFAGHGYTNSGNPSKSHLCLSDSSDPLTVGDVLKLNLHEKSPFLAYLSACSTGQVDNDKFTDESIHLISAFQLAGFRHVIGTLWKVKDKHCVDVARITYEAIRDGGMTDESVCQGLHKATRILRDLWLEGMEEKKEERLRAGEKGMRDVIPCEDDEQLAPAYWVPYVHFGV